MATLQTYSDTARYHINKIKLAKEAKNTFLIQLKEIIKSKVINPLNDCESSLDSIESLYSSCSEAIDAIEANTNKSADSSANKLTVNKTFSTCLDQLKECINNLVKNLSCKEIDDQIQQVKNTLISYFNPNPTEMPKHDSPEKECARKTAVDMHPTKKPSTAKHAVKLSPNANSEIIDELDSMMGAKKKSVPKIGLKCGEKKNLFYDIIVTSKNSDEAIKRVEELFMNRKMKIKDINFTNTMHDCAEFSIFIEVLERWNFTALTINKLKCNTEQWRLIAESLENKWDIKTLKIQDIFIVNMDIWVQLLKNSKINEFQLKNCEINGIKSLRFGEVFRPIKTNFSYLKEISYIECGLDDMSANDLKEALIKNTYLQKLDLTGNQFTKKGYKEIKRYNIKNYSLAQMELVMDNNPCTQEN